MVNRHLQVKCQFTLINLDRCWSFLIMWYTRTRGGSRKLSHVAPASQKGASRGIIYSLLGLRALSVSVGAPPDHGGGGGGMAPLAPCCIRTWEQCWSINQWCWILLLIHRKESAFITGWTLWPMDHHWSTLNNLNQSSINIDLQWINTIDQQPIVLMHHMI